MILTTLTLCGARNYAVTVVLILGILGLLGSEARSHSPASGASGQAPFKGQTVLEDQQHSRDTQLVIEEIKAEVADLQRRIDFVYFLAGSLGVGGIVAILCLVKWAKTRTKQAIEKAIYAVDPTCRPVFVPEHGLEKECRHLSALGFRDLRPYGSVETLSFTGLLVFHVEDEGQVEVLTRILEKRRPDSMRLGCVLYTSRQIAHGLVERLQAVFPNVTFANSLATLPNALFVVGRGTRP